MASINLDLDYFNHPKTRRLMNLLGKGSEAIPIRLWCYCGKYHAGSGRLTGISTQEIESEVNWRGQTGKAVEALVACGFLEGEEGNFMVHDFLHWSGHIAIYKKRALEAAKARWSASRNATSIAKGNATPSNAKQEAVNPQLGEPILKPPKAVFAAPTIDEVKAYCAERGNSIDPEGFLDFYTANGWVQGRGKPIKDWKACMRTWEKNGFGKKGTKDVLDGLRQFAATGDLFEPHPGEAS